MEGVASQMKCFKCKYYKENPDKTFNCNGEIRNMDVTCLVRHFLWSQIRPNPFKEKAEKMIDKMSEEFKEGEEWKGDKEE